MKIQERIVDTKRHTIGYVINSQTYTRKQAVSLAKKRKIDNVRVVDSDTYGPHIVGIGRNLYDLPIRIKATRKTRR